MATVRPAVSLRVERALLREGYATLAGMDEVGRGSLAGPVSVGVVVVDVQSPPAPAGVRDSKELSAQQREALVAPLRTWSLASAVGHASAREIDDVGIIAALRIAGQRALGAAEASLGRRIDVVLLDGSHDWLSGGAQGNLFEETWDAPRVRTRVKADRTCASVAAASVVAKVERDALMCQLHEQHPQYRWDENKGYSSPAHVAALRALGASELHRTSWSLPGVE